MNATTIVLIPVYNDWPSLSRLIADLENTFVPFPEGALQLVIINDGSLEVPTLTTQWPHTKTVHLTTRLGHQKAIATGLSYIHHSMPCKNVLIMDADGEDQPADAMQLLHHANLHPAKFIMGNRNKRKNGSIFKMYYAIYKLLFRLLTGKKISFGHFMVVPKQSVDRLVFMSDIWNNLAASILKAELPYVKVNTSKGARYDGKSKMSFHSLVLHGLGAISVFIESISVRLLNLSFIIIGLSSLIILLVLAIKWFTALAIPGWASVILSTIIIVLLQGFLLSLFTIFLFLSSQSNRKFIPARHYTDYIDKITDNPCKEQ
ncbi:MAG TPA: glycosyltransferase [Chitinophagaceae bacterium]|nr:glycosyltransferase [Chitinophagaceae bacterium]